jgi:hypothetical protein
MGVLVDYYQPPRIGTPVPVDMSDTRAGHYLYEASTCPLPAKEEYTGNKAVNRQNIQYLNMYNS